MNSAYVMCWWTQLFTGYQCRRAAPGRRESHKDSFWTGKFTESISSWEHKEFFFCHEVLRVSWKPKVRLMKIRHRARLRPSSFVPNLTDANPVTCRPIPLLLRFTDVTCFLMCGCVYVSVFSQLCVCFGSMCTCIYCVLYCLCCVLYYLYCVLYCLCCVLYFFVLCFVLFVLFCIVCIVFSIVCTVFCIVCIVFCIVCIVFCIVCIVFCIVCTVFCIVCAVYYCLYCVLYCL